MERVTTFFSSLSLKCRPSRHRSKFSDLPLRCVALLAVTVRGSLLLCLSLFIVFGFCLSFLR
ncbi:predicted protein [Arabidopsis lyrata subsp. lyrata]|uniref:Predicted protein n=1 Tax=Arabidopsis lyrata subsp. lyrata TaxID=81972 RepID=D7LHL5_ARALL|nr:predicted protein [Arabidopsis lyrata subsp. lyrata]